MPEWSVSIIIAFIGAIAGALPGVAALRKARTEHEVTIRDSERAARDSATREWESLTQSQRTTLEEYRSRLQTVTDRVNDLERQLIAARDTIQELEDRSQIQDAKIYRLQQERAEWVKERELLRARIAELEGCE